MLLSWPNKIFVILIIFMFPSFSICVFFEIYEFGNAYEGFEFDYLLMNHNESMNNRLY